MESITDIFQIQVLHKKCKRESPAFDNEIKQIPTTDISIYLNVD